MRAGTTIATLIVSAAGCSALNPRFDPDGERETSDDIDTTSATSGAVASTSGVDGTSGTSADTAAGPEDWWDPTAGVRIRLQFLPLFEAPMSGFPAVVVLSDIEELADFGPDATIAFVDPPSATPLPADIIAWEPARLLAWVRLPVWSPDARTPVDVYVGGQASAPDGSAFDASFAAAFHLETFDGGMTPLTVPAGVSATLLSPDDDSPPTAGPGLVGRAAYFDGHDDAVEIDAAAIGTPLETPTLTIMGWIYPDAVPVNGAPAFAFSNTNGSFPENNDAFVLRYPEDGYALVRTNAEPTAPPAYLDVWPSGPSWEHVALVYDGTTTVLFVDGEASAQAPASGNARLDSQWFHIGGWGGQWSADGLGTRTWGGAIDEVFVSFVARDKNWILASYVNQGDPTSTYEVAAVELP